MYRQTGEAGQRLTLYVSNDTGDLGTAGASGTASAFRFAQEGKVNVFYWVDAGLGYALSANVDRAELARVSAEVYRQLTATATAP
jgi:anti-sigma factor RsiW